MISTNIMIMIRIKNQNQGFLYDKYKYHDHDKDQEPESGISVWFSSRNECTVYPPTKYIRRTELNTYIYQFNILYRLLVQYPSNVQGALFIMRSKKNNEQVYFTLVFNLNITFGIFVFFTIEFQNICHCCNKKYFTFFNLCLMCWLQIKEKF